jgi:hypothetical protein
MLASTHDMVLMIGQDMYMYMEMFGRDSSHACGLTYEDFMLENDSRRMHYTLVS